MTVPEAHDAASRPDDQGMGGRSHSEGDRQRHRSARVTVAMTRPDEDGRFTRMLAEGGFDVAHLPLTRIAPPRDPHPLDVAVKQLSGREQREGCSEFDVLLLTSKRAIEPVARGLRELGLQPPFRVPGLDVWVVGPATGRAARSEGFVPDRMPGRFHADELLAEARNWRELAGLRILFPRAEDGRDVLVDGLEREGAIVTLVSAYRTETDERHAAELVARVRSGTIDAVPLTAGSAAAALAGAWEEANPGGTVNTTSRGRSSAARPDWPDPIPILVIGPATSARAESLGLPVRGVADPHTLEGLVERIRQECPIPDHDPEAVGHPEANHAPSPDKR